MATPLQLLRAAQQPRQPQQPSQPDGSSILRKISGAVLSPLAMAGNVLDVPGSMVRDTVAGIATGDWDKHNPFDQLGSAWWTDAGNRSSGRDVLTATGLTAPNDPQRWELADFGGFATELALDPLTLVSGLGSGVGKALQGTGKASHLFKVGLPFSKTAIPVGKALAKGLDNVAAAAWKTPIPLTGATAGQIGDAANVARKGLFDYYSGGSFNKVGQSFNTNRLQTAEELAPDIYGKVKDLHSKIIPAQDEFLKTMSHLAPEDAQKAFDRVITHTAETAGRAGDYGTAFRDAYQRETGTLPTPSMEATVAPAMQEWSGFLKERLTEEKDWGARIGNIDKEYLSYFPRAASKELLDAKGKTATSGGLLSHQHSASREDILAGVPELDLQKMLTEDNAGFNKYIGNNPLGGGDQIEKEFGKYLGYDKFDPVTYKTVAVSPKEHAEELAVYLKELKDAGITSIHEIAPAGLLERRGASSARVVANMKAIHETLHEGISSKGVSLKSAFETVGLDGERALDKYARTYLKGSVADAEKLLVDPSVIDAIKQTSETVKNPAWLQFLGDQIDKFNQVFKSNVTMPFPAFHMRNWLSGQHMNVTSPHMKSGDIGKYMRAYKLAMDIREQGQSNKYIREAFANKVLGGKEAFEDVTLRGTSDIGPGLKQSVPKGYRDAVDYVADPENASPLDAIPGGKAVRTGYNTVLNSGSNFAQTAEYYNRMPMYIFLREQGMSPAKAAKAVEQLHFDYSKLSPFERGVMRRIVPFYSFSRKITPQILETLIEQPGGKMAQTIRASNAGRNDEQVMPPHVADTAALPLGRKADGSESFVTGFGLTPEAALPYITAPLDPKGALLNVGSSLTPLLKMPMEMATGQTFFQRGATGGRPLKDLDPVLGRTLSNIGESVGLREEGSGPVNILGDRGVSRIAEHLVSNSPVSRLLTQVRTATDPRKGFAEKATNILSPIKVTDVSPKAQESALIDAASAFADDIGARTWSNRYFPKEMLERAKKSDPQAYQQMMQVNALLSAAKKRAREIGKEQKKPAPKDDGERAVRELLKLAGV